MKLNVIKTDKAPKPAAWYEQGYRAGDFIYTAGVTGSDPVTGKLVAPGDIVKQTRQAIKNIEQILIAGGSDLGHVFKTLCFISDINKFQEFNETYKEFFPENPPARSTVQIGKFHEGVMVEIEVIAAVK
ncbi:MAG: Rid family detoxifying hydrolase [Bacillota bacterium]|nr:Rid family detoxifying hydrolase [Bacillota bacterium]